MREEKRLRRERRGYGRTCQGEIVNMETLAALSGLGYSRPVVAEALKRVSLLLPLWYCEYRLALALPNA